MQDVTFNGPLQARSQTQASQPTHRILPLRLSMPKLARRTFYTILALCFLLSGLLTMASIMWMPAGIGYRLGLMSFLALPVVVYYGVRLSPTTLLYVALVVTILLSALVNQTSVGNVLLFMRTLVFSFLIYRLCDIAITKDNIERILRICIWIGVIQLPLMLMQQALYDYLPAPIKDQIWILDFDFGSFNFKGDSSMGFFLILLITFLLFDDKRGRVFRSRAFLAGWFTVTVLLSNSEMAKLIVILVWVAFLVSRLNRKATLRIVGVGLLFLLILVISGAFDAAIEDLESTLAITLRQLGGGRADVERFLRGEYSRGGAIYYYLNSDFLWVGDGPSAYSNPIDRTQIRGNMGHIFTFYSEVGFLGWLLSMFIFLSIALRPRILVNSLRVRAGLKPLVMFGAVLVLSFTNEVMNDISVVMAYCIFASSVLLTPVATSHTQATEYQQQTGDERASDKSSVQVGA